MAAAAALGASAAAAAQFSDSAASGPMTVSSNTLAPPTGVTASDTSCNNAFRITIRWTGTTSAFAAAYTVERATASGGPYTERGSVGSAIRTYVDAAGISARTTYYYRVKSTFRSWFATSSAVSIITPGSPSWNC
jgi:hypothetical protein